MTKREIRKKEKDELLTICTQIYEELRVINIPVIMPKTLNYKTYKNPLGKCYCRLNTMYDGDDEDLKYFFSICVSTKLKGNEKAIKTVMAHELLHTAAVGCNHAKDWRVYMYLAEWKYHYGLLDFVSLYPDHSDDEKLYQCRYCGCYSSFPASYVCYVCPWCLRSFNEVEEIDHSYEYGLCKKITPYYRGLIEEKVKKINYPTNGIPGLENKEETNNGI